MIIAPGIMLKVDNSVFGDLGRDNILISKRKFKPSNLTGAENIIEGYQGLTQVYEAYGSLDSFIDNILKREKDYTLLCDPESYAVIFSSFIKSYYTKAEVDGVYWWYESNIQREKLLSEQMHYKFRLDGLSGFASLCPFDLFLNDPIERGRFEEIYLSTSPIKSLLSKHPLVLGIEHHIMDYYDKSTPTRNEVGDRVRYHLLLCIISRLCYLRKLALTQLVPGFYAHQYEGGDIHDFLDRIKFIKDIFDENFYVENVAWFLDNYTQSRLCQLLDHIEGAVYGPNPVRAEILQEIYYHYDDQYLFDNLPLISNLLYIDSKFIYCVNGFLLEKIFKDAKEDNHSFISKFQLR